MEATAFALSIIAEARTIAIRITTRIASIRNVSETFRILNEKLDRLTGQLARVDDVLQTSPGAIPSEVTVVVDATLQSVRDALIRSNSTVEKVCSKAFPGATSGSRAKVESMIRRKFRAKTISNAINDIQAPLEEASSQTLTLISMLGTGLKNQKQQNTLLPKLESLQITGNEEAIANAAGRKVDFSARAPLGAVSVSIFMMHATRGATKKAPEEPTGDMRRSIATILRIRAGLPIALAVCGSTVAFLAEEKRNFEDACDAYAVQLERKRTELGKTQGPGGSSLNSGIILSLTILEAKFVQLKSRSNVDLESTTTDLYTSLCVLRYQAQVPVSVLSCMWQVENDFAFEIARLFNKMSLIKLACHESAAKERSLMLHELQLDFCKRQAEAKKTSSSWHARILSGYMEQMPSTPKGSLSREKDNSFEHALLAHTPRPSWSIPNDGYVRVNLARHLVCANLGTELAALLLDARWTNVRFDIGGMLSLKSDFECW